jgi:hypothetical protein
MHREISHTGRNPRWKTYARHLKAYGKRVVSKARRRAGRHNIRTETRDLTNGA